MATDPKKTPQSGAEERAKMMRVVIPALAVGAIVILVAVIVGFTGGSNKKMSDGSNGSADDPDLKEATPGVKYRDLKEGSGEACPPGATVKANYTGWLADGSVFDSNKNTDFKLDAVVKGWQEGIPGMKPGGIRKLVIAPEKGYGNQTQKKIPPGSILIFEVELLSVTPGPRPRRSPAPTDLTKLADGTAPGADDPNLKPIGDKGLKFRDLKEGDGSVVAAGAEVTVDYIGWRTDGHVFDSSWKGNKPFVTPLARVVPGWQQGIPGMKVGGIRKLVIPPELAYGIKGFPPDIPPNATLVFEIELLGTN